MIKRMVAAMLAGSLMSVPAIAAEWFTIHTDDEGTISIDQASVQFDRNHRYFWVKTIWSTPNKRGASSSLAHWDVNCEGRGIGLISAIEYSMNGKKVAELENNTVKMDAVIPDSLGDGLFTAICGIKIPPGRR